jgi:Zn-dependent protease
MNFLMAVVVSIVFVLLGRTGKLPAAVADAMVRYLIALNLVLMFFNLIPLPPLDGAAVLGGLLPESLQVIPRTLEKYGTILFFILFLSGALGVVMGPAFRLIHAWASTLQRLVAA